MAAARRDPDPDPSRWRAAVAAAMLALSSGAAAAEPAAHLDFLHLAANVGGSSGGHAALRIGPEVYHFQNHEGFLRLERDDWSQYRFVNTEIENRDIHSTRVRVSASAARRIRDHLSLLFLVQNRHLDFLRALERDRDWLKALAAGATLELPGPDFFERRPRESPALHELGAAIAERRGPGFAATEARRVARQLAELSYLPAVGDFRPEPNRYPRYPESFSEQAEALHARLLALTAIGEEWPLRDGALIDLGALAGTPGLTASERAWLRSYRERLREALLTTLETDRAGLDTGLALARYAAVSQSLASGRLLVIDPLPPAGRVAQFRVDPAHRAALTRLQARLRVETESLRAETLAGTEPDEAAYNRLENRAAQLWELHRGLVEGRMFRYARGDLLPEGWGPALTQPDPPRDSTAAAADRAAAFRDRLRELYPYDLIARNCVTELVRAVQGAFPTAGDASRALGGSLEPGARFGFIPFRFLELVRRSYRVESTGTLASYRNRLLGSLADDWAGQAAEATTLTSRSYHPQDGDGAFLLFTEDVFWPRPIYGAINLAYGLGHAALGLAAAPADRGHRLWEGLSGVLFSVPELAFGNIRKGRFDGSGDGPYAAAADDQ